MTTSINLRTASQILNRRNHQITHMTRKNGFYPKKYNKNITSPLEPLKSITLGWKSIYIPVLPKGITYDIPELRYNDILLNENNLIDYFENKIYLGKVDHIEYIRPTKPESDVSAYVHFAYFYEFNAAFLKKLEEEERCDSTGYYLNGFSCDNDEFCEFISSSNPKINKFINIKICKVNDYTDLQNL